MAWSVCCVWTCNSEVGGCVSSMVTLGRCLHLVSVIELRVGNRLVCSRQPWFEHSIKPVVTIFYGIDGDLKSDDFGALLRYMGGNTGNLLFRHALQECVVDLSVRCRSPADRGRSLSLA